MSGARDTVCAYIYAARSHWCLPMSVCNGRALQVSKLLNEKNASKSDKDTKLDVLNILANVAGGKSTPPFLYESHILVCVLATFVWMCGCAHSSAARPLRI